MMTDAELLDQHRNGSQEAFADLVRRHIDWVWSVARRRLAGNSHLADDVAQAVFVALWRKPPRLWTGSPLSRWLFGVVNLTCKHAVRMEATRLRHETEAAKMRSTIQTAETESWENVAPHLDELVAGLRAGDRDAVLLRFYEQKSFADVGAALGISEEAARKRVSRATEKLRGKLTTKGVHVPATALTGLMGMKLTEAAPAALAATIPTTGTTSILAKGVLAYLAIQTKLTAVATAVGLLLFGASTVVLLQLKAPEERAAAAAPAAAVGNEQVARRHLEQFQKSLDSLTQIYYRYQVESRFEGDWNWQTVPRIKWNIRGEFTLDGPRFASFRSAEKFNDDPAVPDWFTTGLVIRGADGVDANAVISREIDSRLQDDDDIFVDRMRASPLINSDSIALWGTAGNEPFVPAMLKGPGLTALETPQVIDGHPTTLVESKTPSGLYRAWLDPAAGSLPRQLTIHKTATDLIGGKPLGTRYPVTLQPHTTMSIPNVAEKTWDFVIDQVEITRIADSFVISKANITTTVNHVDGQKTIRRERVTRSEIDLKPDFAARQSFKMNAPDGTRVIFSDKQEPEDARHEWMNGAIVETPRLFGRAVYEDGAPVNPVGWTARLRPDGDPWTSTSTTPEIRNVEGIFSVSLTSAQREMLDRTSAGQLRIRTRDRDLTELGEINISQLSTDRSNPPTFKFKRKP